jgi:hypothetical protein
MTPQFAGVFRTTQQPRSRNTPSARTNSTVPARIDWLRHLQLRRRLNVALKATILRRYKPTEETDAKAPLSRQRHSAN